MLGFMAAFQADTLGLMLIMGLAIPSGGLTNGSLIAPMNGVGYLEP